MNNNLEIFENLENGAVFQSPEVEGANEPENPPVINVNNQSEEDKIIALLESGKFQIADTYPDWRMIGYAIADALHEKGREQYHRLCRLYDDYCSEKCDEHYTQCLDSNSRILSVDNLLYYARRAGMMEVNGVSEIASEFTSEADSDLDGLNPRFSDSIFPTLPEILHKTIRHAETPEEKDLLLLGSIATLSACLPNIYGIYDGRLVYPNLYLFVTGSAAVGKGRLNLCKALVNPIHKELREESRDLKEQYKQDLAYANSPEGKKSGLPKPPDPPEKMLIIPANSSSSGVFQILSDSDGLGVIFETEGDTLQQAFKTDYGNYSDGFRKAFHHESISFYRRTNRESVEIPNPRLSAVLSGTPRQVQSLIPDTENGLFSRFIFYNMETCPIWRDVFRYNEGQGLDGYFEKLGDEFYSFYDQLKRNHEQIQVKLTAVQQDVFHEKFTESIQKYVDIHGPEYVASIRRLGLIAFRLCMVLTALRIKNPARSPRTLFCLEMDFSTVMNMLEVLISHTEMIFLKMPELSKQVVRKSLRDRFLDQLPASFDRQIYLNIAQSLSIPPRTAEGYIRWGIKSKILDRGQHNRYSKN